MSNQQEPDADESDDDGGTTVEVPEGAELPAPQPGLSPEKVIKTVLAALRDDDDPFEHAGVKTAFNFVAPAYRERLGGTLQDVADHFTDPINRALVDHRDAQRGRLDIDGDSATEKVVITDEEGEETTYEFTLTRVDGGKYEDCWMIQNVELVYVGRSPDHQHMPSVEFDGTTIKCQEGEILRDVLLRATGVSPYNDAAQYANCNGMGLCGTCAVEVADGEVSEKTAQEKRRLRLPPHSSNDDEGYRLSCQCRVLGDLVVHKHSGLWGQHVEEYARESDEEAGGDPIRVTDEEYRGDTDVEVSDDGADEEDADDEQLDLSEEARSLLEETKSMLTGEDDEDAE